MRGRPITDADVTRWLVLLGFTMEYIRQKLRAQSPEAEYYSRRSKDRLAQYVMAYKLWSH